MKPALPMRPAPRTPLDDLRELRAPIWRKATIAERVKRYLGDLLTLVFLVTGFLAALYFDCRAEQAHDYVCDLLTPVARFIGLR